MVHSYTTVRAEYRLLRLVRISFLFVMFLFSTFIFDFPNQFAYREYAFFWLRVWDFELTDEIMKSLCILQFQILYNLPFILPSPLQNILKLLITCQFYLNGTSRALTPPKTRKSPISVDHFSNHLCGF